MIDVYMCGTPLHMLSAFSLIPQRKNSAIIFFETYNQDIYNFYKERKKNIDIFNYLIDIQIVKRNSSLDRSFLGYLIDYLMYKKIINQKFRLITYTWNPNSLFFSSNIFFKLSKSVICIEDAELVYKYPQDSYLKRLLREKIYRIEYDFVDKEKVKEFYLTDRKKFKENIQKKAINYSIVKNLDKLVISKKNKQFVLDFFDFPKELENLAKSGKTALLMTQPLSETNYIKETEKKEVFNHMYNILVIKGYKVILKKHPLDTTIYEFEKSIEKINQFVPSELFRITLVKFDLAISVNTSGVFSVPAIKKLNVCESFFDVPNANNVINKINEMSKEF